MSLAISFLIVVLSFSFASLAVWAIDYIIVEYTKSIYKKKSISQKENSQNEENMQ